MGLKIAVGFYINDKKCSYDQQTHYRIGVRPIPYAIYKVP